jgi:hypothetical protein
MKKIKLFALIAFFFGAASAQPVGKVLLSIGPVFVKSKQMQTPLQQAQQVQAGDQLHTGTGGYLHLRMQDGSLLVVRPDSTLDIEVFDYDPAVPAQGRIRYKLQNGTSRSVTGAIGQANKDAFRFNTPVAAIGVRGTDFTTTTTAEQTRVNVNQGAIVIATLGENCQANAFGPCSLNSLLLVAGTSGTFAEVNKQALPRLIYEFESHPNQKQPSRPTEPMTRNLELTPLVTDLPTETSVLPVINTQVKWGRWDPNLVGVSGATITDLQDKGHPIQLANWLFGIGVEAMPERLPSGGQISFNLGPSEAYLRSTSGALQSANFLNGTLGVNFSTAQFLINTDLRAQNQTHSLYAAGPIEFQGYLMADPAKSNAVIHTVLNANLTQAASVLTKPLGDGSTLLGAISWQR